MSILKDSFSFQAFNNGFRAFVGSVPVRFIQRVTAVLAWVFPRNFRLRSTHLKWCFTAIKTCNLSMGVRILHVYTPSHLDTGTYKDTCFI